ncbi:hypothetical protein NCPPB1935_22255 [Xanthomonas campestris pv. nigromaculans]|nr:hypothetical protein NCPPB1935_22255 [Xanthomonas campestris pv. nigromaculans]
MRQIACCADAESGLKRYKRTYWTSLWNDTSARSALAAARSQTGRTSRLRGACLCAEMLTCVTQARTYTAGCPTHKVLTA